MILAIDLAYNGESGWVLWDDLLPDPVVKYGEFKPKTPSSLKGGRRDMVILDNIYSSLVDLMASVEFEHLAYEYTDWHRSLSGRGKKWKVEYAIERKAQWSLGMATATILHAALAMNIELERVWDIGANEAKSEFGAKRKDACANLFASEFPRFRFEKHKTGFLYDTSLGQHVSDHVSDAFVIAHVAAKRIHHEQLVQMGNS